MVYTISIFRELREKFPTWDTLQGFLTSVDGGLLHIIYGVGDNEGKAIIRYEKGASDMTRPHMPWFRSVVWDTVHNLPIAVSPPKATTMNNITCTHNDLVWQDYLDGVMINAYKMTNTSSIKLATRSTFDATGTFYSKKPFNVLLDEAFEYMVGSGQVDISSQMVDWLPSKDYCISSSMSLVLQHPEHRVVEIVNNPRIFIAHTTLTHANGDVEICEDISGVCAIPVICGPSGETLNEWMLAESEKRGWSWQGVTIKDGAGSRWRLRSSSYRMSRSLRGNFTRPEMRFAQLYQSRLIDTYMYYYPEDLPQINEFLVRIDSVVKNLYNLYVQVHITKTMRSTIVDAKWKPHLFSIHGHFLYNLRPLKQFIRLKDVWAYVCALPWQQLAFLMKELHADIY